MESWLIIFLITVAYLAASLAVGLLSGRKASASTVGYVAGDRRLGFVVLYFVLGASIFSAFAFLGAPGWAYSRGAAVFYILAYGTVGLLPWYFFGPRVARLGRQYGYVTQAQLFAHRFQSRAISALLAVISLAAFLPYLTLQMKGAGYVFNVVTEGRVPQWAGAAIAYAVVLIYVFRSGVMGVGWTNTFQGVLMMVLAWVLGLYLPYKLYGGIGAMFDELAAARPEMLTAPGLLDSTHLWTWGGFSSAVAISAIGFSLWPHYFMKIYTAKDTWTLKRTIVFYPTFQIFLVPIVFIGLAAVLRFPGVQPADAILPTIMTSMQLPPVVIGLFCAGALAASMSSGDAILHAAGSVLVRDLVRPYRPSMTEKREVLLIRVAIIAISAAAYYFATISNFSLVYLLLFSYGFIAQIFPILLATFFWRRATRVGALSGLAAGCAGVVLFKVWPELQWQQIDPGIWGLAVNALVFVLVSKATRPLASEHVRLFCVE